jgi:hypothetical protein
MASNRKERLALNEGLFRTANERMAGWEERHGPEEVELYFCECADPECRQKVPLQRSDYEQVRANPCHFFIAPGHEIPDVETVIETRQEWVVIEKDPEVREIVEATALRQR